MENEKTMVVVGGGYAGINLIAAMKKEFHSELKKNLKIILIDKNSFHFKKVKLFKGIVNENVSDLHVPLKQYCDSVIEFIQGELIAVHREDQEIQINSKEGEIIHLHYDKLILAVGSVLREVDSLRGGITLNNLKTAQYIRQHLLEEMDSPKPKLRLAIVGSGITGIETAAEVGSWLEEKTGKAGIKRKSIELFLINDKKRLLSEVPVKVSKRLENRLIKQGIQLLHNKKAEKFLDGKVIFQDNSVLEVDACVWTVGVKPHSCLLELGLALTEQGKIKVDSWYRLIDSKNIYAIGDCVHAVDPISGTATGMSCKEAISQAQQLVKIIRADIQGFQANTHQTYPDLLCIGLGPNDGFVWAQKWGIDFVLSGKLAEKIREYTWNIASLVN